jgi:hypothetical protein
MATPLQLDRCGARKSAVRSADRGSGAVEVVGVSVPEHAIHKHGDALAHAQDVFADRRFFSTGKAAYLIPAYPLGAGISVAFGVWGRN